MDDELSRFEQNVDASAFYDGDGDGDVYPENEYLAPADGSSHILISSCFPSRAHFFSHGTQQCVHAVKKPHWAANFLDSA
jgi:hypothetical protein